MLGPLGVTRRRELRSFQGAQCNSHDHNATWHSDCSRTSILVIYMSEIVQFVLLGIHIKLKQAKSCPRNLWPPFDDMWRVRGARMYELQIPVRYFRDKSMSVIGYRALLVVDSVQTILVGCR